MITALLVALLAAPVPPPAATDAAAAAMASGYQLVWADEFEAPGRPDPAHWTFEQGFVRNGEAQWYQPDNATIENGLLVIEARRERRPNPGFGQPGQKPEFRGRRFINFTSASLTTRGLASWTYGRFEIRARLTAAPGLWPALWFVGDQGRWPASGEIDLMEYYDDAVLGNFAWAGPDGHAQWQAAKHALAQWSRDPDWARQFHIWTMDWDAAQISLRLDGRLVNRIAIDQVHNGGGALPNPFRQPMRLIINLALGGQHGGALDKTPLPARFEIDYVRVYQRAVRRGS